MSRNGRGWGPFSGAQITTMVCVIVAAVAFPVGAWAAVKGSNVFVTDATSGATAKVSAAGAETVAGTVTSKLQGATSTNKVEVTKDQQLLTAEASPSAVYSSGSEGVNGQSLPMLTLVTGDAIIVKSIRVSTFGVTGADPYIGLWVSTDGTCTAGQSRELGDIDVPQTGDTTIIEPFDPGIPVPSGDQLCMSDIDTDVDALVTGYTIPAADANLPNRSVPIPHKHS